MSHESRLGEPTWPFAIIPDGRVHPSPSANGLWYFFSRKHHEPGNRDDAQWSEDLSDSEEFAIFDSADKYKTCCAGGHLYGVRSGSGRLLDLGTRGQQVAKFWKPNVDTAWHGYPLGPIRGREGRDRDEPPPKDALRRLRDAGLVSELQRRRLSKGDHA